MATISVAVCTLQGAFLQGTPIPAPDSAPLLSESVTSSGTSAASSGAVPTVTRGNPGYVWRIAPLGNVWVTFAASPTAAAGTDYIVASGSTDYFIATPGDKVAVIDA